MYSLRCCMVLCCVLAFGANVAAQEDTLPVRDRVWILSKTYQAVSVYFAHWDNAAYGPGAVDSVYDAFISRAIAPQSRREFMLLMREYLALLHNGHCWYTDFQQYRSELPLGFEWTYLEDPGEWIVTSSQVPGLAAGDAVDSIDGLAAEDFYHRWSYLTCASSDYARRRSFGGWTLPVVVGETYRLAVRGRNDRVMQVVVDRTTVAKDSTTMQTTGRWIDEPAVAYIKAPSWGDSRFQDEALRLLDEFRAAECIIVDERGNGGGNTPTTLMEQLFDRPYRWWQEATPLTIGLYRAYADQEGPWWGKFRRTRLAWSSDYEAPDPDAYRGRLILLVDRGSGSAAEDFAMPFKETGRALIIGEPTMGSTGQPYRYEFRDIGAIGIGAVHVMMPDGSPFEGVGITPDIKVVPVREDFYTGVDRALDRAIEAARQGH